MNFRKLAAAALLTAGLWANVACNDAKRTETSEGTETAAAKVTDKEYICPMKCEGSASDKPGKCSVCGMDLEKNPDYLAPAAAPADATETAVPNDSAAAAK